MITVEDNISELGRTFDRYWKLTKMSRASALSHTAKSFGIILYRLLRDKTERKGQITSERLSALKSGYGLTISNRAKDLVNKKWGVAAYTAGYSSSQKSYIASFNSSSSARFGPRGMVQRLLAEQELKLREGHRTFTASSALFKGDLTKQTSSVRGSAQVGLANPISGGSDSDSFVFEWGSAVSRWAGYAAVGLQKRNEFSQAISATRQNMLSYIAGKQEEAGRAAARSLR